MMHARLDELLKKREWTWYRLAKERGITEPAVHRLAVPGRPVSRVDARALEKLCQVVGVGPGELPEWVPDKRRRGQ
jgi:DNA-binding Xre family transcriptional regulator